MASFWWILTLVIMAVGVFGTLLPILPGTTIIFAAAVVHHLMVGPERSVSWWTIGGLGVLTLVSYFLELFSGSLGAKWFGATKWGAIGGLVGGIVGMFFFPVGIIAGPLIGVLAGELAGGKGLLPATRSTWGTLLGTTAGMFAKLAIGVVMMAWFVLAAMHHS